MFALFDLDDTLHDKTASLKNCAEFMHLKFAQDLPIDKINFIECFVRENSIIQPKTQVFSNLASRFSIHQQLETDMLQYFDENFHTYSRCLDNVVESLEFLISQSVTLACVTNGRDFFQRNKIHALGLTEYFSVIVTSGELGVKKPDPLIFTTALNKLGAHANQSVFIGDSLEADMQPAKKLGMKTVWVTDNTKDNPDYVDAKLSSYSQFIEVWKQLTSDYVNP